MRISDIDPALQVWIENQDIHPYDGSDVMEDAVAAEARPRSGKRRPSATKAQRHGFSVPHRDAVPDLVTMITLRPEAEVEIVKALQDIETGNTEVIPAGMTDEEFIAFMRS